MFSLSRNTYTYYQKKKGMDTTWVMYECCLYLISEEISIRCYAHPSRSIFDTHLFIFVTEAIYIRICIRGYPCSNPNLVENMKTNITSMISSVSDLFTSLPAPVEEGEGVEGTGGGVGLRATTGHRYPMGRIRWGSSDQRRSAVARPAIG